MYKIIDSLLKELQYIGKIYDYVVYKEPQSKNVDVLIRFSQTEQFIYIPIQVGV